MKRLIISCVEEALKLIPRNEAQELRKIELRPWTRSFSLTSVRRMKQRVITREEKTPKIKEKKKNKKKVMVDLKRIERELRQFKK